MNLRQSKKLLKIKIKKLESDNSLMKQIISNNDEMLRVYDLYNKPLNVIHTSIDVHKYKTKKVLSPYEKKYLDDAVFLREMKQDMARSFIDAVESNLIYEIDEQERMPIITATLYIGKEVK